jgi:phenylalanyl-tRNA synthetase beta chain
MKISYKWLKEYVEDIPPVEDVVSALTMHSFEVEGVEENDNDNILDVKILPNRSHDCLSHYGIASEIASVCGLTRKELLSPVSVQKTNKIKLNLESQLCRRGIMIYISGVKVVESPDWLKEKLKSVGQRPINSIVDITNYLMYAFGQPMHAFDAGKLKADKKGNYEIKIREAKKGEKIKLLNDIEYELDQNIMVIADTEKALDIAGVMGGKDTGVSEITTDIILSLSAFDSVSIRKTASKLRIRTDASQRFENDLSPALADRVLPYALKLVSEISGGEVIGGADIYKNPQKQTLITTNVQKISNILGIDIESQNIIELLKKQNIQSEEKDGKIIVTAPFERLDLSIPEDVAEEVGRLYGYENIPSKPLASAENPKINKIQYVSNIIRQTLLKEKFSEIQSYSLVSKGDVEIANPIASDKGFLRKNLADAMSTSLEHNFKYLDLLGISEVKLFEIGKVFKNDEEFLNLSLGVKYPKIKKDNPDREVSRAISEVEESLGISFGNISVVGGIAEINLDKKMSEIKIPEKYPEEFWKMVKNNISYKSISQYPFAVRDVAVFVPNNKSTQDVQDLISKHLSSIVVRFSLFDTFVKGEKTSYAFRLVFQSMEKTLTDNEINLVMNPIYETLKSQEGFEIR